MNIKRFLTSISITIIFLVLMTGLAVAETPGERTPLGTGFTYQGQLKNSGSPYTGSCDFQFALYDAVMFGSSKGEVSILDVPVSQGYFTVTLDFGATEFTGDARWLEIWLRCPAGSDSYIQLQPRQPVTAAPYAIHASEAGTANSAGSVPWTGITEVPAGFADGIDNDTTYTAGSGLSLTSGTFSADTAYLQRRVSTTCAAGSSIRAIAADGSATCETDDNTLYMAGTGLTLTGATFSINTSQTQVRVVGVCSSGSAIRTIAADGTVTCEPLSTRWSITGNTGTNPATNYLGTSDNQALEIKVNALRVFRFEPNATSPNLIGGWNSNWITSGVFGAVIAGGGKNGNNNYVTDNFGIVGGGSLNQAGDNTGTTNDASYATVGGGYSNTAKGSGSTIAGGESNITNGNYAAVGGGSLNSASGLYSVIPGGYSNFTQGEKSFAAGTNANAFNAGCFVWADSSEGDLNCSNDNRWVARASGGVYFYTNAAASSGMYLAAGGSAWNAVSNRDLKENFSTIDKEQLLANLAQYPISSWNYKAQDESVVHVGMMADEFNSLVAGLGGEGADTINSMDATGVALAAAQGLYAENQELKSQVETLQQENQEMDARLTALEQGGGTATKTNLTSSLPWVFMVAMAVLGGGWMLRRRQGGEK